MKQLQIILSVLLLLSACDPYNHSTITDGTNALTGYDSVYTIIDIQWHKQYYPLLDRQVFSIDLLTEGLSFDSAHHIVGTGLNLYFSDIFLPLDQITLQDGVYHMDSTANASTFLPYKYFEGNVTGCYLLDIQESKIQKIIGFSAGEFEITSINDDMYMDISLYLTDSTCYRATYQGPAIYQ